MSRISIPKLDDILVQVPERMAKLSLEFTGVSEVLHRIWRIEVVNMRGVFLACEVRFQGEVHMVSRTPLSGKIFKADVDNIDRANVHSCRDRAVTANINGVEAIDRESRFWRVRFLDGERLEANL